MQYIVFTVNDQYYGMATDEVEEISKTFSYTPVPKSPHWVEGLINLRGQVMTLANFDRLLNPSRKNADLCYNHTIIAHIYDGSVALMIDRIEGITDVDEVDMQSVSQESDAAACFPAFGHIVSVVDLTSFFTEKEG